MSHISYEAILFSLISPMTDIILWNSLILYLLLSFCTRSSFLSCFSTCFHTQLNSSVSYSKNDYLSLPKNFCMTFFSKTILLPFISHSIVTISRQSEIYIEFILPLIRHFHSSIHMSLPYSQLRSVVFFMLVCLSRRESTREMRGRIMKVFIW